MPPTLVTGAIPTALGTLSAVLTPQGLACLSFEVSPRFACAAWVRRWEPTARIETEAQELEALALQLRAYAAGQLRSFDVPLDLRGTPFQVAVWQALLTIGYGETRSYSAHAEAIGRPSAVRAVGAANGANPVAVIVPCHRLVGKDGALVKYGGGLARKRQLLLLEGALSP
jgi:O-6-methylguanine DNA methyltransferase